MPRKNPKTSRERIGRAKHATQVLKLRMDGLSQQQIANKLGVSRQRIGAILCQEIDRLNADRTEQADRVARLELGRLDEMHKAAFAKARRGDLNAVNAVIRIMERRARLLGLDVADREARGGGASVVLNFVEQVVSPKEVVADATPAIEAKSAAGE